MQEIVEFAKQAWVLWMLLLFTGICAWAFWPRNKDRLEAHGRIPLEDDAPDNADRRSADRRRN